MNIHILLPIAEHADLGTILALMLTSRAIYSLLRQYQRSIVKKQVQARLRNPLYPAVYAPTGRITGRGYVLEAYSFPMIQELDIREHAIETLFDPGQLLYNAGLKNYRDFADRTLPTVQKFIFGLSRACTILDRLADCVADTSTGAVTPAKIQLKAAPSTDPFPLCLRRLRRAQMAVLRALGMGDLVFVSMLIHLAGVAWADTQEGVPEDALFLKLKCANEEVMLRHGTRAIHAITQSTSFGNYAALQS